VTALVPLVGRHGVLADLTAALDRATGGRGGLLLVTGEPGVGKTRVAEELAATRGGVAVHWARCTGGQSGASLRPWAVLLRRLAADHGDVADLVHRRATLDALLTGVPAEQAPGWSLLAADLADALRLAAAHQPLLLVLDDLHDAQASTLRLLAELVADLRGAAVLVVGTARDSPFDWQGREALRAELLGQADRVPLGPLDAAEVGELLGTAADAQVVTSLLERTGGNALLVTEMARSLDGSAVPPSLRAIVRGRLDRLDPASRELLRAASVLGPRFRLDVLADTAELPLGVAGRQLGQAYAAGLADPVASGEARFTHELLRDAVYDELSPGERQHWHARAGLALEHLLARRRDVEPAQVAHHLLLAGPEHASRAAAHALAAARGAAGMGAYDDAVRWYDVALAGATDPLQRSGLRVESARAQRGCGDHAGARATLLRAASEVPTPELLAEVALALGSGPGGFEVDAGDGEQLDLLGRALAALPPEALALRASLTARLSVARSLVAPVADRVAQAHDAVDLARASGDPIALAGSLAALCDALAGPDHVAERLAHAGEIVALAGRDAEVELLGRRLRVVALLERGDRTEAEREQTAYALRAEAVRHPLYLWYVPLWQAMWALTAGRYDECLALNAQAAALGAGSENAYLLTTTQRWVCLAQAHDTAGLDELFGAVDPRSFGGTWAYVAVALSLVERGRREQAAEVFAPVAGQVLALPRDSEWLSTLAQACVVVDALGGHPLAPALHAALLPYRELFVVEGIGAAVRGPVEAFLARVAPDARRRAEHEAAAQEASGRFGLVGGGLPGVGIASARTARPSLRLEGDVWAVCFGGRDTRVRDSKGMRDLAALLAAPGREIGALDLYGPDAPLQHDTGEVLDRAARAAYTGRLRELGDGELPEREAAERDFLLAELGAAYGLGGRVRRTGSTGERARSAVTARLRETLRRLAALDPDLGRHLDRSVRTGTFCSYAPETPVAWDLTT
jgi:hypothetical protein